MKIMERKKRSELVTPTKRNAVVTPIDRDLVSPVAPEKCQSHSCC